ETFNQFSPLSSESESEAEPSLVSTPPVTGSETLKLPTISFDKLKTLVIGDSITRSIRLKTNHSAIIHCLPGGRATNVKANLKMVLAKAKMGECREYRDIVIHVGTNDVRMKQSEVTKRNIASACKSARKMCLHQVIVSGPLPVMGSDELYSRVSQLNR
uniref:SGNH hydrolase-type esterase domain-containing protein n=1 Tax=Oncorhynchus tshawytscha TaxID=74940 RepID=A0AAZ3Q853_ONCTS